MTTTTEAPVLTLAESALILQAFIGDVETICFTVGKPIVGNTITMSVVPRHWDGFVALAGESNATITNGGSYDVYEAIVEFLGTRITVTKTVGRTLLENIRIPISVRDMRDPTAVSA